ncbi:MAG: hypothetical protein R3B06_11140 [Kofleriaceae bacterium]
MSRGVATTLLALIGLAIVGRDALADGRRLAVIAVTPEADLAAATAAARAAGRTPVTVTLPTVDDTARLRSVEAAFDTARAAWLAQRYADMDAGLAATQADALALLARPEHAAALWQLAFLRGLAASSQGDAAGARRWFGFALELAPTRRPSPATYPPAIDEAFALAAEALAGRVAAATRVQVTPADAVVVVDGQPLLEPQAPRFLRRGLHAILAEAPGFEPTAALVDVDAGPLVIALTPAPGAPTAGLAPLAARGLLDTDGPSTQALARAAGRAVDADEVLLVGARGARLLRAHQVEPWRPTAAAALQPPAPLAPPAKPTAPADHRWLWWGGAAAVIAAGVVTAVVVTRAGPDDRTQIGFAP